MQLTTSRLVVAIATFVTGITVAAIWFAYRSPTPTLGLAPCATPPDFEMVSVPCSPPDLSALSALPIVEYCDLIRGSVQYHNRIVRVRGIYWSNCENNALDDPSCHNGNRLTWVEGEPYSNFDQGMKPLYQFYGSKAKWGDRLSQRARLFSRAGEQELRNAAMSPVLQWQRDHWFALLQPSTNNCWKRWSGCQNVSGFCSSDEGMSDKLQLVGNPCGEIEQ